MRFLIAFTIFNVGLQIVSIILNVVYVTWGMMIKKKAIPLNETTGFDPNYYIGILNATNINKTSENYTALISFIQTADICAEIGSMDNMYKLKLFIESLDLYNNTIEVASMAMIPLQIIGLVIMKFCCSECDHCMKKNTDEEEYKNNVKQFNLNKSEIFV